MGDNLTVWIELAWVIVGCQTELYVLFLQTMNLLIRYFHKLMVSLVGVKATVNFIFFISEGLLNVETDCAVVMG